MFEMLIMDSELFHPTMLAQLFEIGQHDRANWTTEDLQGMLIHQLDTPLPDYLQPKAAWTSEQAISRPDGTSPQRTRHSFRQILLADTPPIELLKKMKNHVKGIRHNPDHPLPIEISTALYYACISAAWIHARAWISSTDAGSFRSGLTWLIDQSWVEPDLQQLYRSTLDQLMKA